MGVFDGEVKTKRVVDDPGKDHALPDSGSLSFQSIKGTSALSSTTGTDTLLLTGDRDRQMNGNESTRIMEDRTHTILGNQKKSVTGNRTDTTIGNHLKTIMGNLHRSIVGATNDLFTGAHLIEHKANQMLQEPVEFMHYVQTRLSKSESKWDTFINYCVTAVTQTAFTGHFTDFRLTSLAGTGLAVAGTGINLEVIGIGDETRALHNEIAALDSKIGAIQPAVYVTMLHEVAITQKILIIGVNQYI